MPSRTVTTTPDKVVEIQAGERYLIVHCGGDDIFFDFDNNVTVTGGQGLGFPLRAYGTLEIKMQERCELWAVSTGTGYYYLRKMRSNESVELENPEA